MKKEIWLPVVNYEGLYEVSNLGRVKSLKRWVTAGHHGQIKKESILKQSKRGKGYNAVGISKNEKRTLFNVHTLVAMAFLNHTPNGMKSIIDHIDGNPSNNNVDNLQVTTNRVNISKGKRCKNKSSNSVGVFWNKNNSKWQSKIQENKKQYHLGFFESEKEASKAYKNALALIDKGDFDIKKAAVHKKYSSTHKGVSWDSNNNKWAAYSSVKGGVKRKFLGYFKHEQEAADSVKKLAEVTNLSH